MKPRSSSVAFICAKSWHCQCDRVDPGTLINSVTDSDVEKSYACEVIILAVSCPEGHMHHIELELPSFQWPPQEGFSARQHEVAKYNLYPLMHISQDIVDCLLGRDMDL